MSILISSDWHFSDAINEQYRFNIIEKSIPALIKKHAVKLVLFLGDVCEAKDEHQAELVNRVVRVFDEISAQAPVIALQGNHDWLSSPQEPFFGFLDRLPNVTWINTPTPLAQVVSVPFDVSGCILLPHTADYKRDWGKIDFTKYSMAFCHQSFAGAVSESGFALPGGVPLDFFPPKLKIISGDVHKAQTIHNLTYVGAPYAVDFGDNPNGRMLLLKDNKITSLSVEGPSKVLVEVSSLAQLEKAEVLKGDIVKVRMKLNPEDRARWPELSQQIRAWGLAAGVTIQVVQPDTPNNNQRITTKNTKNVKTDAELITEYVNATAAGLDVLQAGMKFI